MHNRGLYHYHAAAGSHMSTHLLCIMTREPVITAFSLKIQLPAHRWLRPSHAVIVFCDLWENYLNVLWTKCHLNKLAKDRKDRNTGTLGCYESPDPLNNKLISGGHFVKSLLWLLTCTGLLHLNRHPWAVHTASVSCGGSRVRGTSSVQQGLQQQTAALSGAVMGPISNWHWSTFKCNRTSHSALQMFILASRYPTKPAFFTLAASKSSICPEKKKHIHEEKPKKNWGYVRALSATNLLQYESSIRCYTVRYNSDCTLFYIVQACEKPQTKDNLY